MADSFSGRKTDHSDSTRPPNPLVVPRSSSASTLGKENVAVAVSLIALGLFLILAGHWYCELGRQSEQNYQQQVAELNQQIEQASNEQKKTELQEQLQRYIASHDFPKTNTLWNWCIVEVFSGVVLNLLLLIAGIGLMRQQPWGRRLSIITYKLKIVRLLALYLFFIVLMFRGSNTPTDPAARWADGMTMLMGLAFAVSVMTIGMIYPVAKWRLLKDPKVAAECLSVSHSTDE